MSDKHENAIGVREIAELMHVDRRTVQRLAKTMPWRLTPRESPGRGYWFERSKIMKWIAQHKHSEADRHRRGRKRKAMAPQPGQKWTTAIAAVPNVPYDLFRSTRRVGCAALAAKLGRLAAALTPLPEVLENIEPKIRLQCEYDQIMGAIRRIRDTSQDTFSRFLKAAIAGQKKRATLKPA